MRAARTREPVRSLLPPLLFLALCLGAACGNDGPILPPGGADNPGGDAALEAGLDASDETVRDVSPESVNPGTDEGDADPGPGAADTPDAAEDRDGDGGGDVFVIDCPAAGALLITEFLPDPVASGDAAGEYVELANPGTSDIDLRGFELHSGKEVHRIAGDSPVLVPAGGRLLMAAGGDSISNGGLVPGYVYASIKLTNEGDDLSLVCGDVTIDGVAYDLANWGLKAGHAMVLDPSGMDAGHNDDPAYWCLGQTPFGAGDLGSPGQANVACGASSCGDDRVQHWESCDGGNALPGDGCSASCATESFAVGSVIVTEFLYDPAATSESAGEWVEFLNTTANPIDIAGWTLADDGNDSVAIRPEGGSLVVPPGGYRVLGRSADTAANGGVDVAWAYGGQFTLANGPDEIVLSWNGTVIDRVAYAIGADAFPAASGRSLQLDPSSLDASANDQGSRWCPSPDVAALPGGDKGSPGSANSDCP